MHSAFITPNGYHSILKKEKSNSLFSDRALTCREAPPEKTASLARSFSGGAEHFLRWWPERGVTCPEARVRAVALVPAAAGLAAGAGFSCIPWGLLRRPQGVTCDM